MFLLRDDDSDKRDRISCAGGIIPGHQSYMVDLWNAEGRAHANASAFFAREHIATIDTLPFLEELIASDVHP